MKKSKFIRSSILLIIGGFITKLLGMLVKIVLTRKIGIETLGLYYLILPTYLLIISIVELSMPTALNVLISSKKYNNKNILIYAFLISIILDIVITLILLLNASFIAKNLLNNETLKIPIMMLTITLPFIITSNIMRAYFFAKERIIPHIVSNILEDVIKLALIILFIDLFKTNVAIISFIILINIASESSSIIIFLFKAPKYKIEKRDLKANKKNIKDLLNISVNITASRIIGSITYFLEPIILTKVLKIQGYTTNFINTNYGIISGYVLPLILLPSFFTSAISQALIPNISEYYSNKKYNLIKRKIKQALIFCLILGIFFTSIIMLKGNLLLKLIYATDKGFNYLLFIAPVFLLHYITHPMLASLQAMKKTNITLLISIISFFIRTIGLYFMLKLNIGFYALLIIIGINIILSTLIAALNINRVIKKET